MSGRARFEYGAGLLLGALVGGVLMLRLGLWRALLIFGVLLLQFPDASGITPG